MKRFLMILLGLIVFCVIVGGIYAKNDQANNKREEERKQCIKTMPFKQIAASAYELFALDSQGVTYQWHGYYVCWMPMEDLS